MSVFDDYLEVEAASLNQESWPAITRSLSNFRLLSMHVDRGLRIHLIFNSIDRDRSLRDVTGEEDAVRFAIEFEDCSHLKVDGWGLLCSFDMHKTPRGYFEADFRGVEAAIGFRFGRLSIRGARRFRSGAA